MKERERLIELLKNVPRNTKAFYDQFADYLLANGVIVSPCKAGQTIYRNIIDKPLEFNIVKIEVFDDEMLFIDDIGKWFGVLDIGKTVFLTREEAEAALRKEDKGK